MQNQKGGFRGAKQEKPKEQIEYEEATKNLKVTTTKLRLSQQGIDTSSISRQELDRVMALFDKMDAIAADVRNKTTEIQRESNVEVQKINQKANEKYSQVSKEIDAIVNKMKKADKISEPVVQSIMQQDTKEEVMQEIRLEKLKEDMTNAFADRIMQKVRREVINAFEDYANATQLKVQTTPQVTIGKGIINKEAAKEIALKVGQDMIEKSSEVESGERPDDKDIPVIDSEMKKTEEEITK